MATPVLITANTGRLMVDGQEVPGVQYIKYKVMRNRQNIHSLSSDERIGAYYGGVYVHGIIKIKSVNLALDAKMYESIGALKHFQLMAEYPSQGATASVKKVTFDECYLDGKEFELDATGVAVTTYEFTSTRIREEDGSSKVEST